MQTNMNKIYLKAGRQYSVFYLLAHSNNYM